MKEKIISVASVFSNLPGLRHCNISANSGEEFYHDKLNSFFKEALENNERLIVNLDGTDGYASSFLDEAFGNLVYDFTLEIVKKHLDIISVQEPHWKSMIENETFIQWEKRRKNNDAPIVTESHSQWFRLVDKRVELKVWELPRKAI